MRVNPRVCKHNIERQRQSCFTLAYRYLWNVYWFPIQRPGLANLGLAVDLLSSAPSQPSMRGTQKASCSPTSCKVVSPFAQSGSYLCLTPPHVFELLDCEVLPSLFLSALRSLQVSLPATLRSPHARTFSLNSRSQVAFGTKSIHLDDLYQFIIRRNGRHS